VSKSSSDRVPFAEMLRARWEKTGSLLCVGLDPELARIPTCAKVDRLNIEAVAGPGHSPETDVERWLLAFTQAIVRATADAVCAFKPNSAFYEQYGVAGVRSLQRLIGYIHAHHPGIPVILDAKRGDIGSTSAAYARFVFDELDADAVTLHPYLGRDAIAPFLERAGRGTLILCRTSNPGSGEFQDLTVTSAGGRSEPLYQRVARTVAAEWNTRGNCGLVVGATKPDELRALRKRAPELPFLIPGVGTQGGRLEQLAPAFTAGPAILRPQ